MSRAPENLKAVRSLLLAHLNVDPDSVRGGDLEPAEVGIVGDSNHWGGYHCGEDRILRNADGSPRDYSVIESSRDRAGLTLDAAALDVGLFEVRVAGKVHNLRTFSIWCVAQCKANAPDTRDIREIVYSPDGEVVRRFDRLGRRSSGDDSHLWHTHFSWFRDAIKAGRDQTSLFRRYLASIGLLEDDMITDADADKISSDLLGTSLGSSGPTVAIALQRTYQQVAAVRAELAALAGRDLVDEQELAGQLLPGLLAALTPEKIAAAIPPALAREVADELARRLAS